MGKGGLALVAVSLLLGTIMFIIPYNIQEASAIPTKCYGLKVKVNILKDSPFTEEDFKKMITKANKILKKLCIKLVAEINPKLTKHIAADADKDGRVDQAETKDFFEEGYKEAKKIDAAKKGAKEGIKGVKIWGVKDAIEYTKKDGTKGTSWGLSSEGYPVIIIPHITTRSEDQMASSIAHEVGHKLGLKHPDPNDDDKDDDKNSNVMRGAGHSRDQFVKDNGIDDLEWSQGQKDTIFKDKKLIDKEGKKIDRIASTFQATNAQTQVAVVFDDVDDQTGGKGAIFDLNHFEMVSEVGDDNVSILLGLGGPLPTSGAVDTIVSVLYDSDNNAFTGIPVFGFTDGFDREVRIELFGDLSVEPLHIEGILIDWNAGTDEPLNFETVEVTVGPDVDSGGGDIRGPFTTAFLIEIPKSSLGFSVTEVPIGLITWEFSTGLIFDSSSSLFMRDFHATQPSLVPDQGIIQSGQTLSYTVNKLSPDTTFDLFFDDDLVAMETTDSNGDFAGSFDFPDLPTGFHFLTAVDSTGAFAFNIVLFPSFNADLDGSQEVPPVTTSANGLATFLLNEAGDKLEYEIVTNLDLDGLQTPLDPSDDVIGAHIHQAPVGVNGGIVVGFIGPTTTVGQEIDPALGKIGGTITTTSLINALAGQPLSALLDEMRAGNTYLNIHTQANIGGEIRGQITTDTGPPPGVCDPNATSWTLTDTNCDITSDFTVNGICSLVNSQVDILAGNELCCDVSCNVDATSRILVENGAALRCGQCAPP